MILGLGTDLVTKTRITRVFEKFPQRFLRILALCEHDAYEKASDKSSFLAKRWCIKEAAAKALGTGIRQGVRFADFAVMHNTIGQPQIYLSGVSAEKALQLGVNRIHVSVTDEQMHAMAVVILES